MMVEVKLFALTVAILGAFVVGFVAGLLLSALPRRQGHQPQRDIDWIGVKLLGKPPHQGTAGKQ